MRARGPALRLPLAADELRDPRRDLLPPAPSAEDAVVPGARLHVLAPALFPQPAAERMRGGSLSDAGDVVVLSFDGHQGRPADGFGLDRLAPPGHLSARQIVALEHAGDGL